MQSSLLASLPPEDGRRPPHDDPAILLVNLNPVPDNAARLRTILESAKRPAFRLFEEYTPPGEGPSLCERLPPIIRRVDPSIVFLVLLSNLIGPVSDLLRSLATERAGSVLVPIVDGGGPDDLFELLMSGAADFVMPPLSPANVLPRLWRLLGPPSAPLQRTLKARLGLQQLIGRSPAFSGEVKKIPLVARCDATVLISGETGTGKELFSRAIHYLSGRSRHAFIPVNCGAIPADLAEAELFGHERGAFTGAVSSRAGLIADAEGGTLFLDEIDCLPAGVQVKLLRFLQEKEYRSLGSGRLRKADVRVIAATNGDLEEALKTRQLRRDLYYRLNVLSLTLPPLRDRREDIPLLANHFLSKYLARLDKRHKALSPEALGALMIYDWPGNVRELENMIERAVVLSEKPLLTASDMSLPTPAPRRFAGTEPFRQAKAKMVDQFERGYLENLLAAHHGNITSAARAARKDRRAFFELLRKHAIDAGRFRRAGSE
jgi:DNA-binding NtrC family response regulator